MSGYVYITQAEKDALGTNWNSADNPFDADDFDEELVSGYWFARVDEIQPDEWEWSYNHEDIIVIKQASYNDSNQIIVGPL